MRRFAFVAAAAIALAIPAVAQAIDVEVAVVNPADGTHSLSGVVPVMIQASSDVGIYAVQLQIDGKYYGAQDMVPSAPFEYEIDVDTSKLTQGTHTLTAIATDWSQIGGGQRWASDDVSVDVGPAYPTIAFTAPASGALVRGTINLTAATTSAVAPATTTFSVDGGSALASSSWNSTTVSDGAHVLTGTIVDGRGKQAAASEPVTVDNTPPTTSILGPTAGSFATGTLQAQANASDAHGVASVQFLLDGTSVGSPVTTPDGGSGFSYSASLSLSGLSAGSHTVSDIATDIAGNTATSTPVAFTIGNAPPSVSMTLPPDWTFAHGTVLVTANVSGGTQPDTAQLVVDGSPTGPKISAAPYQFSWNTTSLADGAHTIAVKVTDGAGRTATSAVIHQTVDNTPPQTYIIAPAANTFFQSSLPVQAHASSLVGIQTEQFLIDGTPVGAPSTAPDTAGGFTYSTTLSLTGLASGPHTVSSLAIDSGGLQTTSSPVTFDVGAPPATVAMTAPLGFSFAHATTAVTASILGGDAPFTAQLIVDGAATSTPSLVSSSTATLQWDTTKVADGSHSIQVAVTGADGVTSYSSATTVTVENAGPEATMYQPTLLPGYTYARIGTDTQVQVHASDAYGVHSVQFTVDGVADGPLLTAPDSGQLYLYSTTLPASAFPAGMHTVSAIVTNNAGVTTTAAPVSVKGGPLVYVPVLNYHGITGPLDTEPDIYDQSPTEADQQLAYLKSAGYQSITVEQYLTWLNTGTLPTGVTKPVLITVDDGLTDEEAWDLSCRSTDSRLSCMSSRASPTTRRPAKPRPTT